MGQVGKSIYIGTKWVRYRLLGNQLFYYSYPLCERRKDGE